MPSSFEQQRELIATFRSVARSLLASPEEPVMMKDLDGNLLRSRVRTVMNRLIELGFVEETKERADGSHYAHLEWRLVDEPAQEFLSRIIEDQVQTSRLLWPNVEDIDPLPEDVPSGPLPEEEPAQTQDPVALVAAVLEGFNDRIASMEKRQEHVVEALTSLQDCTVVTLAKVEHRQEQIAGGMSELIAAVSQMAARAQPKPYDDTELLLTLGEYHEAAKLIGQTLEQQKAGQEQLLSENKQLAQAVLDLAKVAAEVRDNMTALQKNGIEAKNKEMWDALQVMAKAFMKMTKQFDDWKPSMEECIKGAQVVNTNVLSVGEEITSMQTAIVQSLNVITKGVGVIKPKSVEPVELRPLPGTGGLRRNRGLPSLSQMVDKKNRGKLEGNGLDLFLPGELATQLKENLSEEGFDVESKVIEEPKPKGG